MSTKKAEPEVCMLLQHGEKLEGDFSSEIGLIPADPFILCKIKAAVIYLIVH